MTDTIVKGTLEAPAKTRGLNVFGVEINVLLTGVDTGGAYAMYDVVVPPGGGPPPHVQSREDEAFYVVKGTIEILKGDTVTTAGPGDHILIPLGTRHAFCNVGETTGRMVGIASPSGHEHFFADADALGDRVLTDPEAALELCRRHGITVFAGK